MLRVNSLIDFGRCQRQTERERSEEKAGSPFILILESALDKIFKSGTGMVH